MIVDGEGNNFIMTYEQLLEKYMEVDVIWSSSIMWQQHENEFDILIIQ
jgi:coenzyme F420-reducing hydrogenase gamma subunit